MLLLLILVIVWGFSVSFIFILPMILIAGVLSGGFFLIAKWKKWGLFFWGFYFLFLFFVFLILLGSRFLYSLGIYRYDGLIFTLSLDNLRVITGVFVHLVNGLLIKGKEIQSISSFGVRNYLWCSYYLSLTATLVGFILLHPRSLFSFSFLSQKTPKEKTHRGILLAHTKDFVKRGFFLTEEQLVRHVYVLGASGYGKSVLLSHIIKNRVSQGLGLMFLDLKSDLESILSIAHHAKSCGRLQDVKFFSLSNPEISHYYNILGHGTANQLKDRIMGAFDWSEEFYKNEASSYLLKILRVLVFLRDFQKEIMDVHLGTLLQALQDINFLLEIRKALQTESKSMEVFPEEELNSCINYLSSKSSYNCLQGLRTQIENLLFSDFGYLLCPRDCEKAYEIDFLEAIENQKVLYILLDSRRYGDTAKSLGRMILQDLKSVSAEIDGTKKAQDRKIFSVIVDEFSDLAQPEFLEFLDRARSSGLGTIVAHQELSDLKKISPEYPTRLLHLTSTVFAFLTKIPESAETLSGIIGTQKSWKQTERTKSGLLGIDQRSGEKSIREVEEFVIHPNTFKALRVGECVVIGKYPHSFQGVFNIIAPDEIKINSELHARIWQMLISRVHGEGESTKKRLRPDLSVRRSNEVQREKKALSVEDLL